MLENNNYELILNRFKSLNFYEASTLKDKIHKNNHIEVRKLLSNYNIVKPWDTNRSCGKSDYFDIPELKTSKIIRSNSKLVVTRPTLDSEKPVVYVYQNWQEKFWEITEKIIGKGYFENFQNDSKKIKGWFDEHNLLRFGTKKTDSVYVEFDRANLNSLLKQKYYFEDEETGQHLHLSYQAQLSALGAYFGLKSKLAKGEKNQSLYGLELNTIANLTMEDLNIENLKVGKSKEQVDYLDVIWANKNHKILAAFEVELKRDWLDVLSKFQNLKLLSGENGEEIYYVIVGNHPNKDIPAILEWVCAENIRRDFENTQLLKYLPIQNLKEILYKRDKHTIPNLLREEFFNGNILVDIN